MRMVFACRAIDKIMKTIEERVEYHMRVADKAHELYKEKICPSMGTQKDSVLKEQISITYGKIAWNRQRVYWP